MNEAQLDWVKQQSWFTRHADVGSNGLCPYIIVNDGERPLMFTSFTKLRAWAHANAHEIAMGMVDEVTFRYRMPDGREGEAFQTKNLDCLMDIYEITPTGRLVRKWMGEETDRPLGDMKYSGMLKLYAEEPGSGEYILEFVDGTLAAINCKGEPGRLIFDHAQFIQS